MAKYCVFFIALPLPVIVRTICLFDNFEKLSMLLGFSGDLLKGWARICCVHVYLVYLKISYEMMKDGDSPKGTVVHRGKMKFLTPVLNVVFLPDFYQLHQRNRKNN